MRFLKYSAVLCLLMAVLLGGWLFMGCGGDDGGGGGPDLIDLADFEGSWGATSYKMTSVAKSKTVVDLVAEGMAIRWDADDEGNFSGRGFIPAALAGTTLELPVQGSFEIVTQESIAVSFTPQFPPFITDGRNSFTLVGNTFNIRDDNAMFDFDGDQVPEPAIFEGTMTRYPGGAPPVIFIEDFEGHWDAAEYKMTAVADAQRTIEMVSLGAMMEMDIADDGSFVGDAFIPAAIAGQDITIDDFTGYHEVATQDTMQTTFTPEYPPFMTTRRTYFTLVGDTLSVVDGSAMFDFQQGHGVEPAIWEGRMVRTTR